MNEEEQKYLEILNKISNKLESFLKEHAWIDKQDAFRILMNSYKTNEEKLASGLRRRIISGS